jgi:hypothetical protein
MSGLDFAASAAMCISAWALASAESSIFIHSCGLIGLVGLIRFVDVINGVNRSQPINCHINLPSSLSICQAPPPTLPNFSALKPEQIALL